MTAPTIYSLRNSDGRTIWRGTISPAPGGGSQPGAVRVLKHDFDFSQATALAAGVSIWTPAVGDVLLNAWILYDSWVADGMVSPIADIGIVGSGAWAAQGIVTVGLFGAISGNPVDLSSSPWNVFGANYAIPPFATSATIINGGGYGTSFAATDPLALAVSDDGTPNGNAFDGSSGSATLYLVVSTPVATP